MTKRTTLQIVLEAVQDMHNAEQTVTRETLQEVTGLKLTIIDDRLGYLVDNGLIHRVQRGVFVPTPQHEPARFVSKTLLPGGIVKIEVGEDVLTLTPREDRMLGALMASAGVSYSAIELGHQSAIANSEHAQQIRDLQRQILKLQGEAEPSSQGDDARAN